MYLLIQPQPGFHEAWTFFEYRETEDIWLQRSYKDQTLTPYRYIISRGSATYEKLESLSRGTCSDEVLQSRTRVLSDEEAAMILFQ